MFGLSIKEQSDELFEQGFEPLLRLLNDLGCIDNDELPRAIWSDAYMQGFFFGLALHLRGFMVSGQPMMGQPTEKDMAVVSHLLENHLALDGGYEDFQESVSNLETGNIKEGWSKDEYVLATNHAINVVALTHNRLAPEFHNEKEIIEAKNMAKKFLNSEDYAAAYLPAIYLKERIKKLTKS